MPQVCLTAVAMQLLLISCALSLAQHCRTHTGYLALSLLQSACTSRRRDILNCVHLWVFKALKFNSACSPAGVACGHETGSRRVHPAGQALRDMRLRYS